MKRKPYEIIQDLHNAVVSHTDLLQECIVCLTDLQQENIDTLNLLSQRHPKKLSRTEWQETLAEYEKKEWVGQSYLHIVNGALVELSNKYPQGFIIVDQTKRIG